MSSKSTYFRKNYCYSSPSEESITRKTLEKGLPIKLQALDWANKNEKVEIEYSDDDSSDDNKKSNKETLYYIY